jgi:hypothetical protein
MKRRQKGTEENITILSSDNYSGPLNLLVSEKVMLLKSAIKHSGNRAIMARFIGVSLRNIFRLITAHSLDEIINDRKATIILLESLEKEYPLIFINNDVFDSMFKEPLSL